MVNHPVILKSWIAMFIACSLHMTGYALPGGKKLPREQTIGIGSIVINALDDPDIHMDSATSVIPFTLAGKLIVVQGRADSIVGNFILDTGAPNLVLNSTYFRGYPVSSNGGNETSITGEGQRSAHIIIQNFNFGSLYHYRIEADMAGLGHIENSKGIKIIGLLGVGLFRDCELIINYTNKLIYLHRIGKKERKTYKHPMLADSSKYMSFGFDIKDNRILINTQIADKKLQFVIDYAAESNIIDSRLPNSILNDIAVTGRILLTGADSKKIEAMKGEIAFFNVGKLQLKDMPVIITNLENTCFGNENCINGVLGHDFLSRYTLVFNFVKRKMYILE